MPFLTRLTRLQLYSSLSVLLVAGLLVVPAAAQKKGVTISESIAKKDADYAVQGEYVGEVTSDDGKVNFGAQIVGRSYFNEVPGSARIYTEGVRDTPAPLRGGVTD